MAKTTMHSNFSITIRKALPLDAKRKFSLPLLMAKTFKQPFLKNYRKSRTKNPI